MVQISPSCQTILGYRPEEMIGRSGVDFIHPDHLDRSREEMRAARRGQHPKISDTRCFHKDGHEVWLSWLGTWSEPVKRFFFVGRDMTESRLAQETLRESEQLARGIIDTALDAFVQIDEQGTILDWNTQAENLLRLAARRCARQERIRPDGPSRSEARSRPACKRSWHRPRQRRSAAAPRTAGQAARRHGNHGRAEHRRAEDARRLRVQCLHPRSHRQVAAEERIRQAEKMEAIGQLTGGIAHDFNNILTVITGTIEILADAVKGEPQLAAITRMIDEAASRGADLTQHLLAFARKQPLEPKDTDVNTLIIDTAKLLQRTLGEHVEIESVFEDETCPAIVDPNQLATAILNLALNARDAMPDGGKLIIETGFVILDEEYAKTQTDVRPGRYAMIAVSDTGTGIPAAHSRQGVQSVLHLEGSGQGHRTRAEHGIWLRQAIRRAHHDLQRGKAIGTTIKMYLPPAMEALPAAAAAPAPAVEGGHETIMVVEDDTLVRNYVLTQLHSLGYVTLDAANATDALLLARNGHSFDLLFTDVIMPGMNGRQLANEMAKVRPGLKVLFTSGYTENADHPPRPARRRRVAARQALSKSDMAVMIRKALAG